MAALGQEADGIPAAGTHRPDVSAISFGAWAIGGAWGTWTTRNRCARCTPRWTPASTSSTPPTSTVTGAASGWWRGCAASARASTSTSPRKPAGGCRSRRAEGYSRENLTAWVERSLQNLETEALDLLQLHCPPPDVYDQPEVFGILDDLVAAGKLRHYGVSVETVDEALRRSGIRTCRPCRSSSTCSASSRRRSFSRGEGAAGGHPRPRAPGEWPAHRQAARGFAVRGQRPPPVQPRGRGLRQGRDVLRVPYEMGLAAVERLRPLVPRGGQPCPARAALDPDVRRGDVRDPRGEDPGQARDNAAAAALPPSATPRWRPRAPSTTTGSGPRPTQAGEG